jgi:hypothetical protein
MEKRDLKLIITTAVIAIVAVLVLGTGVTGFAARDISNIPDEQCHTLASNLDKAADGKAWDYEVSVPKAKDPCTGDRMNATTYWDFESNHHRRVYSNGNVVGGLGSTDYVLCTDGRAAVSNFIRAYYSRGIAWGLWFRSPMGGSRDNFILEKCNTI